MAKIKNIWDYDTSGWDREEAKNMFIELRGRDPEDDEDIEEFIYSENQLNLEIELEEIHVHEARHGKKKYVVLAVLGLWDGKHAGGKVITGLENAIKETFEDYNHIYMEGKRLKVDAIHHDGINNYQIRELTPRGEEYLSRNMDLKPRRLHEILFKDSHYSHEVSMFKEIYGW